GRGRHARTALLRSPDRTWDLRRRVRVYERSFMSRKRIAVVVLVTALALVAAGLASATRGSQAKSATGVNTKVSGTISFDGIWTSSSGAKQFADVIKAFNKKFPNVKVNYKPVGDNLPTVLSTAVAGGHPPDMADIAQPGFVKQLADQGKLKPITYAKSTIGKNRSEERRV